VAPQTHPLGAEPTAAAWRSAPRNWAMSPQLDVFFDEGGPRRLDPRTGQGAFLTAHRRTEGPDGEWNHGRPFTPRKWGGFAPGRTVGTARCSSNGSAGPSGVVEGRGAPRKPNLSESGGQTEGGFKRFLSQVL